MVMSASTENFAVNKRHVISVVGLPQGTVVHAWCQGNVADEMVAGEDVTGYLFVQQDAPLPGWNNRGVFASFEEGQMIRVWAPMVQPPMTLAEFPYEFGGRTEVNAAAQFPGDPPPMIPVSEPASESVTDEPLAEQPPRHADPGPRRRSQMHRLPIRLLTHLARRPTQSVIRAGLKYAPHLFPILQVRVKNVSTDGELSAECRRC